MSRRKPNKSSNSPKEHIAKRNNTLAKDSHNAGSAEGSHPTIRMAYSKSEVFAGPLPPPAILAEYDRIVPGCAEKIIDQFIEQGNHRRSLESKVIDHEINQSTRGLYTGGGLATLALAIGAYAVYLGQEWGGFATIFTSIGSLVGIFIYGTRARKEERIRKTELLQESD